MKRPRNLGIFYVHMDFFNDLAPGEGVNLFHDMVVLRAVEKYEQNSIEYIAAHPQFRQVDMGEMLPEYEARFDSTSALPTWVEVDRYRLYRSKP